MTTENPESTRPPDHSGFLRAFPVAATQWKHPTVRRADDGSIRVYRIGGWQLASTHSWFAKVWFVADPEAGEPRD